MLFKKLVVNADDFGLTESVNMGIIHCYEKGIVTSTSIIANGKAFDHAVSLAKKYPKLGVGIHLTLVEEFPLSEQKKIASLVGKDSYLLKDHKAFVLKYFMKKLKLNEIKYELEQQVKKVKLAGINISHIDSHQHLHMLPDIFKIVIELAKKYKIKNIRMPNNFNLSLKSAILNVLSLYNIKTLRKNNIFSTDHFLGLTESGKLDVKLLKNILNKITSGNSELIVHPGKRDNVYRNYYSNWDYEPEKEMNSLCNSDILQLVKNKNIALVNFHEIRGKK